MSYQRYNGHDLWYTRRVLGTWVPEAVDVDAIEVRGWHSSLALDSQDNPHIVYWAGREKVRYAAKIVTWVREVVDDGNPGSIVLDAQDTPRIAYYNDGGLMYSIRSGYGSWLMETVDPGGGDSSLVLDGEENPHISFEADGGVKYAYGNTLTCGSGPTVAWKGELHPTDELQTVTGLLPPGYLYRVVVHEEGPYHFTLCGPEGLAEFDPTLCLYDEFGELIVEDDPGSCSSILARLSAGIYHLAVSSSQPVDRPSIYRLAYWISRFSIVGPATITEGCGEFSAVFDGPSIATRCTWDVDGPGRITGHADQTVTVCCADSGRGRIRAMCYDELSWNVVSGVFDYDCSETSDSVSIVGPSTITEGCAEYTAIFHGADGHFICDWGVASGPGFIDGDHDGETVQICCGGSGRGEINVRCMDEQGDDIVTNRYEYDCQTPGSSGVSIVLDNDWEFPGCADFTAVPQDVQGPFNFRWEVAGTGFLDPPDQRGETVRVCCVATGRGAVTVWLEDPRSGFVMATSTYEFFCPGGVHVRGSVTDVTGAPISAIEIRFYDSAVTEESYDLEGESFPAHAIQTTAVTNGDGEISLNVHTGTYKVLFIDSTELYSPKFYDDFALPAPLGSLNPNVVPDVELLANFFMLNAELRSLTDCNSNGIPDDTDLANGSSLDCDLNGTPDECEVVETSCDTAFEEVQDGESAVVNPSGGGPNPLEESFIEFTNTSGRNDAVVHVTAIDENLHPSAGVYRALGHTMIVDTSLEDGEFFMTVMIAFDDTDVGASQPLSVDIVYYDASRGQWSVAVAANTRASPGHLGPVGDRFAVTGAPPATLSEDLGDYGVYWNSQEGRGFAWANVDHTTDFTAGFPLFDGGLQRPGDCSQDGALDISDGVCLLGHLFQGIPPSLPCGDTTVQHAANVSLLNSNDHQGAVDLSDAVYVFTFLFLGGPPPVLGTDCVLIPDCPEVCTR